MTDADTETTTRARRQVFHQALADVVEIWDKTCGRKPTTEQLLEALGATLIARDEAADGDEPDATAEDAVGLLSSWRACPPLIRPHRRPRIKAGDVIHIPYGAHGARAILGRLLFVPSKSAPGPGYGPCLLVIDKDAPEDIHDYSKAALAKFVKGTTKLLRPCHPGVAGAQQLGRALHEFSQRRLAVVVDVLWGIFVDDEQARAVAGTRRALRRHEQEPPEDGAGSVRAVGDVNDVARLDPRSPVRADQRRAGAPAREQAHGVLRRRVRLITVGGLIAGDQRRAEGLEQLLGGRLAAAGLVPDLDNVGQGLMKDLPASACSRFRIRVGHVASGGKGPQGVHRVHRRGRAGHEVSDRAVHQSLLLYAVFALKRRGGHLDRVVATAAGDLDRRVGDLGGDSLANGVRNRALKVCRMMRHCRVCTTSSRPSPFARTRSETRELGVGARLGAATSVERAVDSIPRRAELGRQRRDLRVRVLEDIVYVRERVFVRDVAIVLLLGFDHREARAELGERDPVGAEHDDVDRIQLLGVRTAVPVPLKPLHPDELVGCGLRPKVVVFQHDRVVRRLLGCTPGARQQREQR